MEKEEIIKKIYYLINDDDRDSFKEAKKILFDNRELFKNEIVKSWSDAKFDWNWASFWHLYKFNEFNASISIEKNVMTGELSDHEVKIGR